MLNPGTACLLQVVSRQGVPILRREAGGLVESHLTRLLVYAESYAQQRGIIQGVAVLPIGCDSRLSPLVRRMVTWGAIRLESSAPVPVDTTALTVVWPSIKDGMDVDHVDRVLALHPIPPVVLVLDFLEARDFVATRVLPHVCWLDDLTPETISAAVATATSDRFLERVRVEVLSRAGVPLHLLTTGTLRLLGRVPPARTRSDLAQQMGCDPDYLGRVLARSGVRLNRLMRWTLVLDAIALSRHGKSWREASEVLGFESPSGFCHFARTLTGRTPTELAHEPLSHLEAEAMRDCLGGPQ